MIPRTFGDTGVCVSPISLGCWIFGVDWWGHRTQEDCNRLCAHALDHGITFFDNGDAYGNGRAETLFGNWYASMPQSQQERIQIGGKFGYDWHRDPGEEGSHRERKQDFSPGFMRRALEDSLGRLRAEAIDIYLAHNIKLPQFRDDLFAELEKVRDEGKIRAWGISLGPAIGWRDEGFEAMEKHGAKCVQTVYNYLEQHPGRELAQMARSYRAGMLARVQDNSGVLKDQIRPDTKLDHKDHRKFRDMPWRVYGPRKVDAIRPIFRQHGMTAHQFACKWILQSAPEWTSITGTFLNELEIDEAVAAADMPDINARDFQLLHELYERDFDLPPESHACDLKSSVAPEGKARSQYVAPPVMIA